MPSISLGPQGRRRLTLYAWVILAIQVLGLLIWSVRFYLLDDWTAPMVGIDFPVFWSATQVTIEHGVAAIFSPQWMFPMEEALRHDAGYYSPWPYPPTFLLAVFPLGLLSFGYALILYFELGVFAYGAMLAKIARKIDRLWLPLLAAFPGVSVAIGLGQNSLFTVAAAGAALALLETGSGLAGVCIALLAIKPQFGILFPLALICGRHWKVLGVSAFCTLAFVGITTAVFGREAWDAFFAAFPVFRRIIVEDGGHLVWIGMPTVFSWGRAFGLSVSAAYVAHGLVALPAVLMMSVLWVKRARFELRAVSFVAATLLMQPYIMFYDLVWLILPILFLMRDAKVKALNRMEWVVLAAAWLAPAQGILAAYLAKSLGLYLQIVPAVLLALLAIVMRRHFASASAQSHVFQVLVDRSPSVSP